jgi:hypothetical protein
VYDDKTIAKSSNSSFNKFFTKRTRDKYRSLNYEGNKIHVQNYKFADGKKRLIYKIPKEIGGDNQYRLFNKPGVTSEDFAGFAGDLIPLTAEILAGFYQLKEDQRLLLSASDLASGILNI